jgi:hypothetical protein
VAQKLNRGPRLRPRRMPNIKLRSSEFLPRNPCVPHLRSFGCGCDRPR